jgi:inner membrane protein
MFVFSHVGYTFAAALLLNNSLHINRVVSKETDEKASSYDASNLKGPSATFWRLVKRTKGLDLRFIVIGSLLPDIIDKPIGRLFFNETFGTGRLYGHTLLFLILLSLTGYIIYRYRKASFMLLLAFGTLVHLILDCMWLEPRVLLWPLYGFTFKKGNPVPFGKYLWSLVITFFNTPWKAIPELIALAIICWFVWLLWRQKKLRSFILRGQV